MTPPKGKRSGAKRDFMQFAREVVEKAIGEKMDGSPLEQTQDTRNPHVCTLVRASALTVPTLSETPV